MTMMTRRSILLGGVAFTGTLLYSPGTAFASTANEISVQAGQTLVVGKTTRASRVVIAEGGSLTAPEGYSLTMTVDGVETGQVLASAGGTTSTIAPGTYRGTIVLTVAEGNSVAWYNLVFPFRQALYVGATGIVDARSVLTAVTGGQLTGSKATGISIRSTGEVFNGVYVSDGIYALKNPRIALTGNGRCDFVGYGAAIVGTGSGTTLIVDGAQIANRGVVRTGVVADAGANVIVKNSTIHTDEGALPSDYVESVYPEVMETAPWMLGLTGNVRATNLLGDNTKATYINSKISSQSWGALSTDAGRNTQLTAIDCHVAITGKEGYGAYADGSATDRFLGTTLIVPSYAVISTGGQLYFADSTAEAVAELNTSLSLGLTAKELAALPVRSTTIDSRRFGVMWHGSGSADVSGGTIINTAKATFLDKGKQVTITVDGSEGAALNPQNGIILQIMETDDPGPVTVDGKPVNQGVYTEPTDAPTKVSTFDVTEVHSTDSSVTLTDITINGDFYNGMRGGPTAQNQGMNMVLTLNRSRVEEYSRFPNQARGQHHHRDRIPPTR